MAISRRFSSVIFARSTPILRLRQKADARRFVLDEKHAMRTTAPACTMSAGTDDESSLIYFRTWGGLSDTHSRTRTGLRCADGDGVVYRRPELKSMQGGKKKGKCGGKGEKKGDVLGGGGVWEATETCVTLRTA